MLGIDYLRRSHNAPARPRSRPWLAGLLGWLLPGLGAVYNRQNVKAVAHFITVVGLFQLSSFLPFKALLALAGVGFYFYSIFDAYRTAKLIAKGESPAENEERFKRALARRAPAIGLILIVAGLLAVIQIAHPWGLTISFAKLIPVALIFLGGYLLTRYFKRSREGYWANDSGSRPPYPLIPARLPDRSQTEAQASRPSEYR